MENADPSTTVRRASPTYVRGITWQKEPIITGISGQDGSYLAELLIEKGYEVHGIVRRSSALSRSRIDHLRDAPVPPILHYGDLTDASSINRLLREIKLDEIYNLGAQSHVKVSFDIPEYTADTAGLGTLRILEGIRESGTAPRITRQARPRCSAWYAKSPRPRAPRFIRVALRRREGLCALDRGELPRGLRDLHLQRHPLQPRVAPPRRELRLAQDPPRSRCHQARHQESSPWAISTRSATGVTRKTMWCDVEMLQAEQRATTSSPPERPARSESSASLPSAMSGSIGGNT